MCHDLLSKVFGSTLVGTIDLKYDFVHRSSSIFRQLEISLKFGESFVNIEAKSRAIKAKKNCLASVLALVSKFQSRFFRVLNVPFRPSTVEERKKHCLLPTLPFFARVGRRQMRIAEVGNL